MTAIGLVFDLLKKHKLIDKKEKICVQVDFTTSQDDFLILCASIIVGKRSVPLYFSMRNDPKKAGSTNHSNMALAFLCALRHTLSNRYQYVIIADRSFGNQRFISYCEALGFDDMIRLEPKRLIERRDQNGREIGVAFQRLANATYSIYERSRARKRVWYQTYEGVKIQ